MKRKVIIVVSVIAVIYLLVSIWLSYLISVPSDSVNRWKIVRNRAPFLLFEAFTATVTEENGRSCGYDQHGDYVGYDSYKPGDRVYTMFFYNPFNNYIDDIAIRIDHNMTTREISLSY